MPTLSTRVSDGEFKAITEYANACGLCVSDLIKKIIIKSCPCKTGLVLFIKYICYFITNDIWRLRDTCLAKLV